MRLILTFLIASAVGSTLVGGLRSFLGERSANPYQTVVRLYREDKPATTRLIEEASYTCLPGLSGIKSVRLRNTISRVVTHIIEAKVQGQRIDSIQFKTQMVSDILEPVAKGASPSDLKQMADLVDPRADKKALVRCIAETVVAMSKSMDKVPPKTLLEDTQLRGT